MTRILRRLPPLLAFVLVILSSPFSRAADTPGESRAEAIRQWLSGGESKPGSSTGLGNLWAGYLELEGAPPGRREAGLRAILESDPPDSLRRVVLLDLQSDLRFQSEHAQFIRRYGFYSNWFNRTVYVVSKTIQGNLTAGGQLIVDAVFDTVNRGRATSAERRLYKLLGDLRAEGRATRQDRDRMAELKEKIAAAQAGVELERAEWALRQGQPGLARYYATAATAGRSKTKSGRIIRAADSEIARRHRGVIASAQAGYPDRKPPLDINSPELLRAAVGGRIVHHSRNSLLIPSTQEGNQILITSTTQPYQGNPPDGAEVQKIRTENFILAWMLTTMDPADGDPITMMRRWARAIENMNVDPNRTRWVKAGLENPAFNPELRLIEAHSARRASLARFVFAGPQTGRERAYIASSRLAQTWNTISSVGVFYIFEIMYRAGIAAVRPPAPADEVLDAQASFLRAAPAFPGAPDIASQLADQYLKAGRPENAQAVLKDNGGATARERERIKRGQAVVALDRAERLPEGAPGRKELLNRARELAPNSRVSRRADKLEKPVKPREERIEIRGTWAALADWVGTPSPSGLPGDPLWFDGLPSNGEVEHPWFILESADAKTEEVTITYRVVLGDRRQIVSEKVALPKFDAIVQKWITLSLEERRRADRESDRLGRTSIPYEFTGGAGFSGVDFYPRLLPVEMPAGESRLYEDPKHE